MTQGWIGLRTAVIALGLFACASTGANADTLLSYGTDGSVDTLSASDGVKGSNVISFVPITTASVDGNSNISLGYFQVGTQAAGESTTYTNTPFSITYEPVTAGGIAVNNAIMVTGFLNGTVTGSNYSTVVATFKPLTNSSFTATDATTSITSTLSVPLGSQLLVPWNTGSGDTTVEGLITTGGMPIQETPAPEPSTIALFLSTVGGLGLRKYVLARRQRSQT